MQPDERDSAYLWDMLDAARNVREFTIGIAYHQYMGDKKLQLAMERSVEIIGEAARRVSNECQQAHPGIPWRKIIAQRHVLAHEYGEIKQELMWKLATAHIPELISALEKIIPPSIH